MKDMMMGSAGGRVRFRSYSGRDRDVCLGLFDANVPTAFSETERSEFAAFLDDLPGPYLVMSDPAGTVIGCGGHALEEDGVTASLCWGMVHPRWQRSGFGTILLKARVEAAIVDSSVGAIRLATTEVVTGFFEAAGFRVVERTPDGFAPGLDSVEMRWERE